MSERQDSPQPHDRPLPLPESSEPALPTDRVTDPTEAAMPLVPAGSSESSGPVAPPEPGDDHGKRSDDQASDHRSGGWAAGRPESRPGAVEQITLRGPAELADALPYMLGYHPTDSIVLVALHGDRGRFGGRVRLGIPRSAREWPSVADQLAEALVEGGERRGTRPDGIVAFLCQDPAEGESALRVMERLRPLAQRLRTACGALDVPVYEALCVSDGRYWSYCCPDSRCCPPDGTPLVAPGTSVMAAAATYAGIQVRGSLRDLQARLRPWDRGTRAADEQLRALDEAGAALVPAILGGQGRDGVREDTLRLAEELMRRLAQNPPGGDSAAADTHDDGLLGHGEAASVILGLQDRLTRDRAAEWMEGPGAPAALRLWRALSRRCVGAYVEHSAAPLTLAGWVSWSTGDEPAARIALGLALEVDPEYVFARLLHQACNENLDPESLRQCLRKEREVRVAAEEGAVASARPPEPGAVRTRTRTRTRTRLRTRAGASGADGGDGGRRTGAPRAARVRPAAGARRADASRPAAGSAPTKAARTVGGVPSGGLRAAGRGEEGDRTESRT
ncbi:DUF4192 domain-containing protein [Streptomyces sp. NPDC047097]|uniref:DUF4192 domain-containing protein n=1 Tax=Streptomyces sp. NPDC047097 TaxID=3155260 RepID=UPI0033E349AC